MLSNTIREAVDLMPKGRTERSNCGAGQLNHDVRAAAPIDGDTTSN